MCAASTSFQLFVESNEAKHSISALNAAYILKKWRSFTAATRDFHHKSVADFSQIFNNLHAHRKNIVTLQFYGSNGIYLPDFNDESAADDA